MRTDECSVTVWRVAVGTMAFALIGSATVGAQALQISRSGSRSIREAPAENFTGRARVDMLFERLHGAEASGGVVVFEPGARTAWHSHPGGQTLIVTAGAGRVQRWGEAVQEIHTGDVVRIPPGQKHWHGAAPQTAMTHLAITEQRDGSAVQWMEQVSEQQYHASPGGTVAAAPPVPSAPTLFRASTGRSASLR